MYNDMYDGISPRAATTIQIVSIVSGFGAATLVSGVGATLAKSIQNPIMRGAGYIGSWGLGVAAANAVADNVEVTLKNNYFAIKNLARKH